MLAQAGGNRSLSPPVPSPMFFVQVSAPGIWRNRGGAIGDCGGRTSLFQYGTSRQKPGNCQNRKKYHCEQPSAFHCFLLGIDLGHRAQELGMRGGQTGLSHSLLGIPSNFWGPGRATPAWQTFAPTLAPVVPAGGCAGPAQKPIVGRARPEKGKDGRRPGMICPLLLAAPALPWGLVAAHRVSAPMFMRLLGIHSRTGMEATDTRRAHMLTIAGSRTLLKTPT